MDRPWWREHIQAVSASFKGGLATSISGCYHAKCFSIEPYNNSGAGAVSLAIKLGAENVLLIGYDMQYANGKRHWHGDHPKNLGNAGKVKEWPAAFEKLAKNNPGRNIINCSRQSALNVFPRMSLEDALNEFN